MMAAQEKSSSLDKSMLRVKVFHLNDVGKWDDHGTGHVVEYSEGLEELRLLVIDEECNDTLLLHQISSDNIYRKEEDTVICWRDPEYGAELALSFQEAMGCSYIWDHIIDVQRKMQFTTSIDEFIIAMQADQSAKKTMAQFNEVNRGNVVSGERDEATGSGKQSNVRTLDIEYKISREVLEQHSGKKLKDVAADLGVSRSTLKRICRKHQIFRWPPSKAKRHNHQELVQASLGSTEESSQGTQRVPNLPLEKDSVFEMLTAPVGELLQDDSSITVKATFKDDMIKFRLSPTSRKLDLEKEVTMRLNLSVGSFKIKYLDEDGDWVLITCDADLRNCLASVGKTTIKMLIDQLPSGGPKSG